MNAYEIRPMTAHGTGAEILNLDLSQPLDEGIRKQLNDDFGKHHVLVMRNQKLTPEQFLHAGEIFGPIMPHHRKSGNSTEHVMVFEIKNTEIAPGKYRIQGESFHTDHSNDPVPPKATSLYPSSLPSRGGDTQFVNMHLAYDELSDPLKKQIASLKAVHVYLSKYSPRDLPKLDEASVRDLPPPAIHPLVRTHPENGRKFLYINPVRIESIVGLPDDEAQDLLAELMRHATQRKYEYRHAWRYGDMVIWDNRSVMHQANADYDMSEVRRLYRIMIKGSLPQDELAKTPAAHAGHSAAV